MTNNLFPRYTLLELSFALDEVVSCISPSVIHSEEHEAEK